MKPKQSIIKAFIEQSRPAFLILITGYLLNVLSCQKAPEVVDLILLNGLIIDGSKDAKPYKANIAIKGDSIYKIGPINDFPYSANQTIDVEGYVVSPGFIDPHTHASRDLRDTNRNANLNYLHQGVTTVFIGSDGRSALDLNQLFSTLTNQGVGTNVGSFIGHNTIRRKIMGMRNATPTNEELSQMQLLVKRGMEAGAIGLSSGLYYAPGSYSKTEEVVELAKVAASYGGVYDAHIRDESSYTIGLLGAVKESIEIAKQANIHSNISHIKCLGVDVWNQSTEIIELINTARSNGVSITADQYPYNASGTSIRGALIPRWVLADDPDPTEKFLNKDLLPKIKSDMAENLRRRGGASKLLLTAPSQKNLALKGKTLEDVAKMWSLAPIDAAIQIFQNGGSSVGSFNMNPSDIKNFVQQEWVMTSSDGSTGHPRKYGSFPKKLKEFVVENSIISLEKMIHHSSGLTAHTFHLQKRGLLQEGFFADIIVFKPEEVKDNATFENPTEIAEGMHWVIVNGQLAIKEGIFTEKLAGKILRSTKK